MKCVHCGQRKGKRRCPALGGDICAQCCGEHRLKTIRCPPDCVHLGGLAVVDVSEAELEAAMEDALVELNDWYMEKKHALPYPQMLLDRVLAGQEEFPEDFLDRMEPYASVVAGCAVYGMADDEGKRAVDRYVAVKGRDLKPAAARVLQSIGKARFGVFLVERAVDGGLELLDVKDDSLITVKTDNVGYGGSCLAGFIATLGSTTHPISLAHVPESAIDDVGAAYEGAGDDSSQVCAVVMSALIDHVMNHDDDDDDEVDDGAPPDPDWLAVLDEGAIDVLIQKANNDPRAWLDEATPLLHGKSARAAAGDPALRHTLHLVLDGIDEGVLLSPETYEELEHALGLDRTDFVYDVASGPDVDAWRALHHRDRTSAVQQAHEDLDTNAAAAFALSETWLAYDMHELRPALERLMSGGLTRAAAIDAVNEVARRWMESETRVDVVSAARALGEKPEA